MLTSNKINSNVDILYLSILTLNGSSVIQRRTLQDRNDYCSRLLDVGVCVEFSKDYESGK